MKTKSNLFITIVSVLWGASAVYALSAIPQHSSSIQRQHQEAATPPRASVQRFQGSTIPVLSEVPWPHQQREDVVTPEETPVETASANAVIDEVQKRSSRRHSVTRTQDIHPDASRATTPAYRIQDASAMDSKAATSITETSSRSVMKRFSDGDTVPSDHANRPSAEEALTFPVVADIMQSARTQVQQCYDKNMVPGDVTLTLFIDGHTGAVKDANTSSVSSTAQCVIDVVKGLKFPEFAQAQASVRYTYRFK